MKAKHLLGIFLLFVGVATFAQIRKDPNAPLNKIPLKYHKDHFGIKGPIGQYNDGYTTYDFDRDGYLVKDNSSLGVTRHYQYSGGKLSVIKSEVFGSTVNYSVTTDAYGRVMRKASSSGSGDLYVYDGNGNLLEERDSDDMELRYRHSYDKQNRLIKTEGYYNAINETSTNIYTYRKDGPYVVVTNNYSSSNPDYKDSVGVSYYKNGNYCGSAKYSEAQKDHHGNRTTYMNTDGTPSTTLTYQYYNEGYTGPNSGGVNKPATTNTTPKNNTTSDCAYGDCQNGWGKKNMKGGYYIGFWNNGKRHGYGLFQWDGSGKYIGFWVYGKLQGYGCYLGTEEDMIGQYDNGNLHGLGYTHNLEEDTWERGRFESYILKDEHSFYTNNVSTGCIAGDCQNRFGRYKWNNGDTFTGFFKNGKMFMGTYLFADGSKYEGMFNNSNEFHGEGRFWFPDGAYYGGQWTRGQYHGRGYYQDKDKNTKIGEWSYGNFVRSL